MYGKKKHTEKSHTTGPWHKLGTQSHAAEAILDEALLAHNALISVEGVGTPMKGLLGKTVPMLMDLEPASATQLVDDDA